jgi:hypothetical protein
MENEIMNMDAEVMEPEFDTIEMENENSGIGTGMAMLIGAGLTIATTAAVKLGKKLWAKHKAKKELRKPDEGEIVEPTDEQIMEVVQ